MSNSGENSAIVRRFIDELWNKKNASIRDELCTFAPDPRGDAFRKAFPDATATIDYQIEHGEDVVTRYTVTGTHAHDHFGVKATQKPVSFTAIFIHRVNDGKIVARWGASDGLALLEQIGGLPAQQP